MFHFFVCTHTQRKKPLTKTMCDSKVSGHAWTASDSSRSGVDLPATGVSANGPNHPPEVPGGKSVDFPIAWHKRLRPRKWSGVWRLMAAESPRGGWPIFWKSVHHLFRSGVNRQMFLSPIGWLARRGRNGKDWAPVARPASLLKKTCCTWHFTTGGSIKGFESLTAGYGFVSN